MMSFESPIGIAIRGKKAGENVRVRLANGRQDMKIIEVK
jgi:transcription elongation GreA/GreB family factor